MAVYRPQPLYPPHQPQEARQPPATSGGVQTQNLSGSVTPSGAVTKLVSHSMAGAVTASGSLTRAASHPVTGAVTLAGALTKQAQKPLTGAVTLAGALTKQAQKPLTGAVTLAGTLTKLAAHAMTGAVTLSGSLTAVKVVLFSLIGRVVAVGSWVVGDRYVLDHFAGTNGTSLNGRTPDVGSNWAGSDFQIQSNKARSTVASGDNFATNSSGAADLYAKVTVAPLPASSYGGVVFRRQDSSNFWYGLLTNDGGNKVQLWRRSTAGGDQLIKSTSFSGSMAVDNVLEVLAYGNGHLRVKVGSDSVEEFDTTFQTQTGVGIYAFGSGVDLDDFDAYRPGSALVGKPLTGSTTPSGSLSAVKVILKSLSGSVTLSGSLSALKVILKSLTGQVFAGPDSFASSFDGPDENPLSEGGVWVSGPGAFGDVQKVGGSATSTAFGSALTAARVSSPSLPDDQYAEVVIAQGTPPNSSSLGPAVRVQTGPTASCYYLACDFANSELKLFRLTDSGSFGVSQLGATVSQSLADGDAVRLVARGDQLEIFLNGTSLGTRSDSTLTSGQTAVVFASNAPDALLIQEFRSGPVAGNLTKAVSHPMTGATTLSGALTELAAKAFAGTLTLSGTFTALKVILKSLSGSVTPSGALTRQCLKPFAGTLTLTTALTQKAFKSFAGSTALSATFTALKVVLKSLSGAVTTSGALTRECLKPFAGTINPSGSVTELAKKNLTSSVVTTGVMNKTLAIVLTGVISAGSALTRLTRKVLAGLVAPSGTFTKSFNGELVSPPTRVVHLVGDGTSPKVNGQFGASSVSGQAGRVVLTGDVQD